MIRSITIIGVSLLFSSSSFALDLQREELLNLYHGIGSDRSHPAQQWEQLSAGISTNYQGNEQDEIRFTPLSGSKTEIGVFTNESLHDDLYNGRDYDTKSPTQFGHNESESYGVYIKKSF